MIVFTESTKENQFNCIQDVIDWSYDHYQHEMTDLNGKSISESERNKMKNQDDKYNYISNHIYIKDWDNILKTGKMCGCAEHSLLCIHFLKKFKIDYYPFFITTCLSNNPSEREVLESGFSGKGMTHTSVLYRDENKKWHDIHFDVKNQMIFSSKNDALEKVFNSPKFKAKDKKQKRRLIMLPKNIKGNCKFYDYHKNFYKLSTLMEDK